MKALLPEDEPERLEACGDIASSMIRRIRTPTFSITFAQAARTCSMPDFGAEEFILCS